MIERVYDKKKITEIVKTMFDDVVEDGTLFKCFDLDVNGDCWLSVDDYNGLFHIKPFNRTTLDLHCYIPEKNRVNAKNMTLKVLKWIKGESPSMYKKIITQVPSIYRHIKIFVLSVGFEQEGSYKDSFLKNGQLYDLNLFGMRR